AIFCMCICRGKGGGGWGGGTYSRNGPVVTSLLHYFVASLLQPFQTRLMHDATRAAPNPLSIFTTVTFDAQLFSIPSSAATPPKLAPYPTLVGTAITGAATSPPTTLGSAPSIPATQITTRACVNFSRCSRSRW